jgi:hypothetical protein
MSAEHGSDIGDYQRNQKEYSEMIKQTAMSNWLLAIS